MTVTSVSLTRVSVVRNLILRVPLVSKEHRREDPRPENSEASHDHGEDQDCVAVTEEPTVTRVLL